jgi:hypothetical protein
MSASLNFPPSLRQLLLHAERLSSYRPARAIGRAWASCVPIGPLYASLSDLPDAIGSSDRLIDLGIAGVSAAAFLWLMHRFGRGRGIVFGLKVAVVSYLYWQSIVVAATTIWIAASTNSDQVNWGFVASSAALSAGVFILTHIALTRLDP